MVEWCRTEYFLGDSTLKIIDDSLRMPEDKDGAVAATGRSILTAPPDKSVLVRRYIDLARFTALLGDKKLHLARPDTFRDQHEGSITEPMEATLEHQFSDRPGLLATISEYRKKAKESVFISCWCILPTESEAMWRLYCGDEYGVAIAVEYQRLESVFVGRGRTMAPVTYIDYQRQGFPQGNTMYPFFHKRKAFEHEQEVRLVEWHSDQGLIGMRVDVSDPPTPEEVKEYEAEVRRAPELKKERGTGIFFDFNVDELVKDVIVHPDAPEWYHKVVHEVTQKFAPLLAEKVRWSSMRTTPRF